MRKIAIFGAGVNGRWLKRFLDNRILPIEDEYKICFYIDNYRRKGSYVEGVRVISPYDLQKCHDLTIIISSSKVVDSAIVQLRKLGISNDVYYCPSYVYKLHRCNQDDNQVLPLLIKIDISKPRLPYLEYPIVNHCNLKCRGCNALANVSDEKFMSIEEYERDFIRLREIFSGIGYLKIFGGEPLLHSKWTEFVKLSRKYFPDSELVVHSNGLLIPKLSSEELDVMYNMDAGFVFTLYPPTGAIRDAIEDKLQQKNVFYSFTEPVNTFIKMIRKDGGYNQEEVFNHCFKCINLIKGTLSCGMGFLIDDLEKKFSISICEDKYKWEHCINIYKTKLNGFQINELLETPSKLCSYCGLVGEPYRLNEGERNSFQWEGGGKECRIEDYVID